LYDATVESGSYGAGNAVGNVVLTGVTGAFQAGEDLEVSSVTVAEFAAIAETGADTDDDNSAWTQAAIEAARANISAVPGSGAVRGVWTYRGDVYAFRDDAGGTAGVMHKASS